MQQPTLKNDPTVRAFMEQHGTACAATTLTFPQYLRYQFLLALLFLLACYDWKIFLAGAMFAASGFYFAVIGYKLLTVFLSVLFRPDMRITPEQLATLNEDELPVYTILIPLYKEKEVAEKVVRAVTSFDYPLDRLDVKLLLEEDDEATVRLCAQIELPECVEVIVVPHAMPKTKPKACNHGLLKARGEFVVIYDAEDRPEPDQLKKAVYAFRHLCDEKVACIQAKLNYYNPDQNLLTKWFALEYTAWFDLFLPGLHKLGAPIPLGGTSNHFRAEILKEIGGWDPFNLTEDCDLGIRLHRRQLRTKVLDSVTWEEANSHVGNWLRQRSRWVKGYVQTHFVHARSNGHTSRDLGWFGFASFLLTVGGLSVTLLLNPFFWVIGLVYAILAGGEAAGLNWTAWQMRYHDRVSDLPGAPLTTWSFLSWIFWGVAVVLFASNFIFILINIIACVRRRLWRLLPEAIISPLYWVLISVAAWKGFLQLFSRPFYWEKTTHGLTHETQQTTVAK
jgi:cellulose synthase/poly-beta-1,6-N-acetylglucosamine synthase-like glycosyltransferase